MKNIFKKGQTMNIDEYLKSIGIDTAIFDDKPTSPTIPNDSSASKKYDLVIAEPDEEEMDSWLEDNSSGWCCYIAANSEYFGNTNFSGCFDCPEFLESFRTLDGASNALVKYLYDWLSYNGCYYEMEGFMGFCNVSTKMDAINLLKSCPVIGTIYEIDDQDNIIATY